ncbi:hypothetical protein SESBI_10693 [Sesbania bispinosa]|nr:hypothetical protein SESBI_10693 [Sesbania bispinosa]
MDSNNQNDRSTQEEDLLERSKKKIKQDSGIATNQQETTIEKEAMTHDEQEESKVEDSKVETQMNDGNYANNQDDSVGEGFGSPFGPWMLVKKPSRKKPLMIDRKTQLQEAGKSASEQDKGSRFTPLHEEEYEEVENRLEKVKNDDKQPKYGCIRNLDAGKNNQSSQARKLNSKKGEASTQKPSKPIVPNPSKPVISKSGHESSLPAPDSNQI